MAGRKGDAQVAEHVESGADSSAPLRSCSLLLISLTLKNFKRCRAKGRQRKVQTFTARSRPRGCSATSRHSRRLPVLSQMLRAELTSLFLATVY